MRPPAPSALRVAVHGLTARSLGALPSRVIAPSSHSNTSTVRAFSCHTVTYAAPPSPSPPSAPISRAPIRDERIAEQSKYVRLVDPNSGALAGPFPTKHILSKLDRSKFWLQQVAPPQPDRALVEYDPKSPPANVEVAALVQYPICKLIDKKEEFDKQRALKRSASSSSSSANRDPSSAVGTSKEVQLTWSVSKNDLDHKLSKAKKEMLKGARINVVVTTKSGGRKYIKGFDVKEDARRQELLQQIEHFLCSPTTPEQVEQAEQMDQVQQPIARRLHEIDWQRGGSAAVMSFERLRST